MPEMEMEVEDRRILRHPDLREVSVTYSRESTSSLFGVETQYKKFSFADLQKFSDLINAALAYGKLSQEEQRNARTQSQEG